MLEKFSRGFALWLVAAAGFCTSAFAGDYTLRPVVTGMPTLSWVGEPNGIPGMLIAAQLDGKIRLIRNGVLQSAPFLDLSGIASTASDDWGFYGFAFHPNYASNGYIFASYIANSGGNVRVEYVRYTANGNPATATSADPASRQLILSIPQGWDFHHGGGIAFGPDGYLYIMSGDNDDHFSPQNYSQNLGSIYGKMLRLDVDHGLPYTVPASNPFVGQSGILPEIWSYGHRNPWRFSFDRVTGDLWIGDVGQWEVEEVDRQPASSTGGENYGWNVFEGTRCVTETWTQNICNGLQSDITMPVYEYEHTGGTSITGGYVYRGGAFPELQGKYIFGDFNQSRILVWTPGTPTAEDWTDRLDPERDKFMFVVSFGEDANGEILVADFGGNIYKLAKAISSDTDEDFKLSLAELLRTIQLYNAGALHCDGGTEDGYAGGAGATACVPYPHDYAPQDWKLSLSELLRAIQIYNLRGYENCGSGEDRICG